jgi:hypothetical protein
MAHHPNSNKHKAQHSGYKKKPGKKEVNALCAMYAAIADFKPKNRPEKPGTQLSLF